MYVCTPSYLRGNNTCKSSHWFVTHLFWILISWSPLILYRTVARQQQFYCRLDYFVLENNWDSEENFTKISSAYFAKLIAYLYQVNNHLKFLQLLVGDFYHSKKLILAKIFESRARHATNLSWSVPELRAYKLMGNNIWICSKLNWPDVIVRRQLQNLQHSDHRLMLWLENKCCYGNGCYLETNWYNFLSSTSSHLVGLTDVTDSAPVESLLQRNDYGVWDWSLKC